MKAGQLLSLEIGFRIGWVQIGRGEIFSIFVGEFIYPPTTLTLPQKVKIHPYISLFYL